MARKLRGLDRLIGGEALVAIVYGEISSSLYFALGIVALWALDLTPVALLIGGALFALAANAYAEGTTAFSERGGAAGIVRRAFGDLPGFLVGWAVLLDLAVVIALSLLFVPHYALAAIGSTADLTDATDALIATGLAVVVGGAVLVGRPRIVALAVPIALLDLTVQVIVAVLGAVLVLDPDRLTNPLRLGTAPTWDALAFAVPIALLAFTGTEVVANLLRESREPARALRHQMIGAVLGTVVLYAVIAAAALSAFPVHAVSGSPSGFASDLSTTWLQAPLAGFGKAVGDELSPTVGTGLRGLVGLSAVVILLFSALTSCVAATRLVAVLGELRGLPKVVTAASRKRAAAPGSVTLVVALVPGVLIAASQFADDATGLATIYSFGILIAFMGTFLAILALRFREPEVERPVRMHWNVDVDRTSVPLTAVIGFAVSWAMWVLVLSQHRAARTVPPLWLAAGAALFVAIRHRRGLSIVRMREVPAPPVEVTEIPYGTIVVPVKAAGPIEDELLASAAKLAAPQSARVLVLHVTEVPLRDELDVALPATEAVIEACRERADQFARDYDAPIEFRAVRGRAISGTIASIAREEGAGLILVGAVPRFGRRAGRNEVFSQTVENLLRRASCRVIVTSFPPGTASLEEKEA